MHKSIVVIFIFFSIMCMCRIAYSANDDGASDLGVDYAFLTLMTLTPNFASANYTIQNDGGSDVDISVSRIPYHIDLIDTTKYSLQFEMALAYQRTREVVSLFSTPGENIDAEWDTYGVGLGLLYEFRLTEQLLFTPSLRLGISSMENNADYNGVLTNLIKDQLDGMTFNWNTNASVLNAGLGVSYDWKLLDRPSSISANVYHIFVDSFSESNDAVKFSENANLLNLNADMLFPTDLSLLEHRVDFVLLLGANHFFGENRRTLGYTTSYQGGVGAEFPIKFKQKKYGYLRVSGQILWASNMEGWLLTIGYNPE